MNIRFQGNYQVYGPTRQSVEGKINQLEQESPVAIGLVTQTINPENPNRAHTGILLTAEDAVAFLSSQNITPAFTDDKALNDQKIDEGLAQLPDQSAFSQALGFASMSLRFIQNKFTEIQLDP